MAKKQNITFYPNKIKYNALKIFKKNLIKVPSYLLDEVFLRKVDLELYRNGTYVTTYSYDNLINFIRNTEPKVYKGQFCRKDITYKLVNIEV